MIKRVFEFKYILKFDMIQQQFNGSKINHLFSGSLEIS